MPRSGSRVRASFPAPNLQSLAFQRGIFYSVRDLETEKCGQNSQCFSIQTDKSLTYLYIGISLMLLSL
ncbi:hypothetical protein FXB85_06185 [Aggregatibacter actinomycetemcomitans]|nr:hypothetical protein FXB85_06185 [Aggregatibacter actinomycetemcomitans]